jgi:hypothetical protein
MPIKDDNIRFGMSIYPFKMENDTGMRSLGAELDVLYVKFYGSTYDNLRYILDPQDVFGPDYPAEIYPWC